MSGPPPWPSDDSPGQVHFERRPPVRWLSPRELVHAGLRVLLSGVFGSYADKRELQGALGPAGVLDLAGGRDELWVDFAADLGDGFDATYTIASLLAQPHLAVGGDELPRGDVCVLGGDQVYPTASTEEYQHRTLGPYRAALPYWSEATAPTMLAVPGNHDWYDGLTSFMRVFCQGRGWIGGWQVRQTRSYFAARLPAGWWLWGIDVQFNTYLDEPQLRFFRDVVAPEVAPGDSIILCVAAPSWVKAHDEPEAFQTLDFFERTVVRATCDATVRCVLSGDSHHYARYEDAATGAQWITSGGGGAFLSATHHLPDEVRVPPEASTDPGKSPPRRLERRAACPDADASRRLARRAWSIPARNRSFAVLVGALYALYGLLIGAVDRGEAGAALGGLGPGEVVSRATASPLAWLTTAVLALGLVGFTKVSGRRRALGLVHLAVHLGVILLGAWGAGWVVDQAGRAGLPLFVATLAAVGLVVGSLVVAGYLYVVDRFAGLNTNELFAGLRIEDHKGFLRLHITPDGTLDVHPIGVRRIGRRWRLRPPPGTSLDPNPSWFAAADPGSGPEPIEPVITIRPASPVHPPGPAVPTPPEPALR